MTTVLSETADKSGLDEWRKRVGEEEAERILQESLMYGRSLDALVEHRFLGDLIEPDHESDVGYGLYRQLVPHLEKIQSFGTQIKLWSDRLRILGRPDIIGEYDGVFSVMDIKNSRSHKDERYAEDYFLQCTMYGLMMQEKMGIVPEQVVLLIADRSSTFPAVYARPFKSLVMQAKSRIDAYYEGRGNG